MNIRTGRRNPGLLPQHLSAVRAAAAISGAVVSGDRLGSTELVFAPAHPPRHGRFAFDVAETADRGSAGSVTLVLQTLLVPLACADGRLHPAAARRNSCGMVAALRSSREFLFSGIAPHGLSRRRRTQSLGVVSGRRR